MILSGNALDAHSVITQQGLAETRTSVRVVVLLPFRNPGALLAESLSSLCLQSFRQFRVVLVNDGSRDSSVAIAKSYAASDGRFHLLECFPGVGLPNALNIGLEAAGETDFVARMDADDIAMPSRFARQVEFLDNNPEVVAVGSFVEFIDMDGDPLGLGFSGSVSHEDIVDSLLCRRKTGGGICHPSVMMRTEALRKVGGYRNVKMGEDIDLFLRLAEVGRLANIPEVLLKYRLHPGNITRNRTEDERRDSQRVRIEAYRRLNIPLPENLDILMPPAAPDELTTYRHWARMAARHGYLRTARKYAWRLAVRRPWRLDSWKTLVRAYMGYSKRVAPPWSSAESPTQ